MRRESIEKREKQMEIQAGMLRAAENRIDKKVDEFQVSLEIAFELN